MMIWWASLKLLGVIFYGIAAKVYKPPTEEDKTFDDIEKKNDEDPSIPADANNKDVTSTNL